MNPSVVPAQHQFVVPAEAGTQVFQGARAARVWIPTYAIAPHTGMTVSWSRAPWSY